VITVGSTNVGSSHTEPLPGRGISEGALVTGLAVGEDSMPAPGLWEDWTVGLVGTGWAVGDNGGTVGAAAGLESPPVGEAWLVLRGAGLEQILTRTHFL
jgi:hypothetical protein